MAEQTGQNDSRESASGGIPGQPVGELSRGSAEPATLADIDAAFTVATAPGQPYEIVETTVDGVRFRTFKNAPPTLAALYRDGLAFADGDFYVFENERYTFDQAARTAARVGNALRARGVRRGDRVGIALRNYPEWAMAFMGITSIGAVAVAMNAWWSSEELMYGIQDSGLDLLFADSERIERLEPHLERLSERVIAVRAPAADCTSWEDFLAGSSETLPELPIAPDDNALILYTSGSTSHPKGVLSTHRGIIHALLGWESAAAIITSLFPGLSEDSAEHQASMLLSVPLFHVAGLNVQLLSSFRQGRKIVAMYRWDPEEALRLIERERITAFNGVPTMAWEIIRSPNFGKHDTSSLKSMGGGGSAMAPEHARQINDNLGNGVAGTGYGMTETNGLGTSISGEALMSRPRSCGQPVPPLVEVKVVDPTGNEVLRGATGEIWIKGAMNFRGYWNKPEATRETLTDGWVHTGDIGHVDDENYVFITDREKDMVIRGGENIGCQEVEAVLYDHPGVNECAVFGLPDERLGETLAAVVMCKPGWDLSSAMLTEHVSASLARFKVPQHIWIQDELLPRIASGKIYKRGLRDHAIEALTKEST